MIESLTQFDRGEAADGTGTVLLVDDNPTNLGLLFDALKDSGFKLLAAEDGEAALAQVSYFKPDIILLDVMMPGLDGFETCQRLKQNPQTQDIPVIFMTALSETVDKVHGFSVGAVDYITKPFQTAEVLARLHTHLAIQRLQRQLQAQNQRLQQEICDRQQAEQSLRVLLHAVSHDLRNPVTGMLMVVKNLLKTLPQASPEATINGASAETVCSVMGVPRHILERMAESGDRQLNLINSLLEAHAIETQGIALHREPLQFGEVVADVVEEMQPLVLKNQATLVSHLPPNLPVLSADGVQLRRVLEHLICNALKHNPPGVALTVEVTMQPNQLRCTVTDNGVGIDPAQSDRLFQLYQRGANARHTHGLGLGLYLCQQIVLAHGGDMGVDSTPGKGCRFWFVLPL
ncbi:MAG: hybrid sensor histidine kinase/response regulator [Leptolyngbyaceae cyanobacterium SL_7_1]|nr:hybrid sensor histidine kinase/response regulator [Leptolyngbyaceae cyanobacterium SL_7_1]